ncbi:MAG: amidohydrolase [Pseudomonadota bacterium]
MMRRFCFPRLRALTLSFVVPALSLMAGQAHGEESAAEEAGASAPALRRAIAADYETNLGPLFRHFHANPELSFRETKTAARLATELEAFGFDVTTGVGKTGIVAVMRNGQGPTTLIRADMDGLPVKENSGLTYASTAMQTDIDGIEKPVMHACGHDVHITSLVGTARQLTQRKDDWAGTLILIGQPAEERISGARAMLEDGLYERFPKPDYALAFHVSADTPTGRIEMPLNTVASSSDSVDIIVHGVGAHGASPHKGIDPVLVGAQIVVGLQSVVSRTIAPLDAGVITVGSFHSGFKHNIISDRAELQLTVRSDDPAVREQLLDGIDRVVDGVARANGLPDDKMPEVIRSKTETTPPTINDRPLATRLRAVVTDKMGDDILLDKPRDGMGAEDFAYFVAPETGVKGVYFSVGGTPPGEVDNAPSHHSPLFKIDPEPAITLGTEAMVWATLDLMKK